VSVAVLALCCKALLAASLLMAGGAKLADLRGFAATAALFLPDRRWPGLASTMAAGVAGGELALGAASLSNPGVRWLNLAVLAACAGFVVVSVVGYLRYPGRPCRCFGSLSGRSFGPPGIGRAALMTLLAVAATAPPTPSLVQLGSAGRLGLLAAGLLVAWCAFAAGAALGSGSIAGSGPADSGTAGWRPAGSGAAGSGAAGPGLAS